METKIPRNPETDDEVRAILVGDSNRPGRLAQYGLYMTFRKQDSSLPIIEAYMKTLHHVIAIFEEAGINEI